MEVMISMMIQSLYPPRGRTAPGMHWTGGSIVPEPVWTWYRG